MEGVTYSDDPAERGHPLNGFLMTESELSEYKRIVPEIKEASPEMVVMIQFSTGSPGNNHEGNENFINLPSPTISRSLANMIKNGVLAAEAGFDGMDLKLCHGHLSFQLLSEINNS